MKARYVHTNLIARDWRRLSQFYIQVFGCVPVPPERDLSGTAFDRLTSIERAHLRGMHLRLPGFGEDGPTLEVFQYEPSTLHPAAKVNQPGFGHIAFAVDDVAEALQEVLTNGGSTVGETVTLQVAGAGEVTLVYCTDPEGNILELQSWKYAESQRSKA